MAMNEHDLDPLDDLEDDDEPRALVRHLRAKIKDQRRQLANAFEDGKTAGRDEEQRDQAWKTTGIPASVRALMGDVDPRDPDALAAKAAELQADGLRWGDEAAAVTARVEEEARMGALDRMSGLAAGGSIPDVEGAKADRIKAAIDRHQEVPQEELAWFLEHVEGATDAITAAKRRGW